jgi:uroporphyrinogen decarboxylase
MLNNIKTPSDIDKLEVPADVSSHPAFDACRRCVTLLRQEVGGKNPICAYITATMTLPALLMGMEKWMELLLLGPAKERDALLEKCHEFFVKEVAAYRQAGADVLIYSNPFGSTDTVPWSFFMNHSLPWIKRDFQAVGTAGMVYYCGMARMQSVLKTVLENTGVMVYYTSPMDDLAEARKSLDSKCLVCGVINDIKMIRWTADEVREEVRRILNTGMAGANFLFGTGVMPLSIPETNLRAMLEAACEHGAWAKGVSH